MYATIRYIFYLTVFFIDKNTCHVLSYNVRGLNSFEKLSKIKRKLLFPEDRTGTPDIYSFQETGSTPKVERFWNKVLPGKIAYSHGDSHNRGVLLGIHPSSPVCFSATIQDPNGRYVIAECQWNQESFVVVAVYFEPHLHHQEFSDILCEISNRVAYFGHNRILWTGDFNVALDLDLDTTALAHVHAYNLIAKRDVLHKLIDTHDLSDV